MMKTTLAILGLNVMVSCLAAMTTVAGVVFWGLTA